MRNARFIVLWAAIFCITGCVISPRRGPGATASTQTALGQIYVSNSAANSIVRFANAPDVTGNVAPAATISGSATQLASPQYLLVDPQADRLFVSNQGTSAVLIFEKASTQNGDHAPDRSISGPKSGLAAPIDLELDAGRDQLYVADGSNVLVFNSASTINGDAAPARMIATGSAIGGILLDQKNDRLVILNSGNNAVDIYDGAHLLDHTVSPNHILSGVHTKLAQPSGAQLDASGRLVITNFAGQSVVIFADTTVNGDATPVAVIDGNDTGMGQPSQVAVADNGSGSDLYIADGAAAGVLVFSNIAANGGNTAPARMINGSKTGLARSADGTGPATAKGIAIDMTR